ncbi:MAG: magnesium transporter [Candidatus Kariarchaeaceae archaeon]|jgi:mgtE-like transporter
MKAGKIMSGIKSAFFNVRLYFSNIRQTLRNSPSYTYFMRIYKESTPVIMMTTLAEIFAGLILAKSEESILMIPGLIIIIPGIMASRGNIVTSLSQRLGTSVHLGIIKWELGVNKEIVTNFYATMILSFLVAIIMGTLGYIATLVLGIEHISLFGFLLATVFMALIMGTILSILTILTVLLSHRLKLDPDNVTVPIVATLGDIAVVGFLIVLVKFLLAVDTIMPII